MTDLARARARAVELAQCLARALRGEPWSPGEWTAAELLRAAGHHGVTALLWQALRNQLEADDPLLTGLSAGVAAEVARAAVRERELVAVLGAFDAHGVPAVMTKGAALSYACYGAPWLRPRTDTDVLIARESLPAAERALRAAGYEPTDSISTGELVSHQVTFERLDRHGLVHAVDVHWKAVNPQMLADAISFEDIRNASHVLDVQGAVLRVPSLEWSLILACVHRLAHHQDLERLGWLYDIHLLASRLDGDGWERFCALARERQVAAVCADGLDAAQKFFSTPVLGWAAEALADAGAHEPSRAYTEREQGRLDVLRTDLRHLPRWRDRLRLLREHAFPPASFMMARYSSRRRAWLPAFYVHRLVTGAWKWMRA